MSDTAQSIHIENQSEKILIRKFSLALFFLLLFTTYSIYLMFSDFFAGLLILMGGIGAFLFRVSILFKNVLFALVGAFPLFFFSLGILLNSNIGVAQIQLMGETSLFVPEDVCTRVNAKSDKNVCVNGKITARLAYAPDVTYRDYLSIKVSNLGKYKSLNVVKAQTAYNASDFKPDSDEQYVYVDVQ